MPLLLSQAVDVFLIARQADSYSPSTLEQYRWALSRLIAHAGDLPLSDITTDKIRAFLAYLQTDYTPTRASGNTAPLGSASLFAAWKAIRGFYKWAGPEFGIQNPSARIPAPRHAAPLFDVPTKEQIQSILKACEFTALSRTTARRSFRMRRKTADRDRAAVLLLLDTGIRASEFCRLLVSDCDLRTGEIIVRPVGAGVKSRPRVIPLGATSRKAIAVYLAKYPPIGEKDFLFRLDQGGGMDRNNLRQVLAEIGRRAGVHVHPHLLRHLFAVRFLQNGGSVFDLMRLLGHTSMDMTRIYVQVAQVDNGLARAASVADNWRL